MTKGKHAFKFGFGYMRNDKNQQQQADTQGDYTFSQSAYSGDAYGNFLLGFASSYQQLNQQSIFHWLNNTYSIYGQDNWHVLPRLTLNLGLRWDVLPHVYEKNNRTSNFVPGDFNRCGRSVAESRQRIPGSYWSGLQPACRRARSVLSEWRQAGGRERIPQRARKESVRNGPAASRLCL